MPLADKGLRTNRGSNSRAPHWVAAAILAAGGAAGYLLSAQGWRMAALFLIGLLIGATLHASAFGFTRHFSNVLTRGDASGVLAQCLMLSAATILFAPILANGEAFARPVAGAVAPAGLQVAFGALMFGIGMQVAGGCGSGTLFGLGGGSLRLAITLFFFCAGSFWASLHMGRWAALPSLGPVSLGAELGWPRAVALQLAVIGATAYAIVAARSQRDAAGAPRQWFPGPIPAPLVCGGIALAVLNVATLVVAGHPWSITWGFTLWGAETAALLGWSPDGDPFWSAPFQRAALDAGMLHDVTSIMNIATVAGAAAAAGIAGRFVPVIRMTTVQLVAAAAGGLAMGYGARIAYGCNVGAYFSGIASTSLHGWIWIMAALPGNWLGVQLRRRFGLDG